MAHVDIATGYSYGEVGATLDLAQFAGNSQNALVRHGVADVSRLRFGELSSRGMGSSTVRVGRADNFERVWVSLYGMDFVEK
jgi:hypothetical protein